VVPAVAALVSPTYTAVDPSVCAALPSGGDLTRFWLRADGTVFYLDNGVKRPIASYAAYVGLGGVGKALRASAYTLSLVPTGPLW
jgi:hypothetical protein